MSDANTEREYLKVRAAGQAVIALLLGAPLSDVTIEGVTIGDPAMPKAPEGYCFSAGELRAQMAVGLGGIAALDSYRFGTPSADADCPSQRFDRVQLDDFAVVNELAAEIDADGAADVVLATWEYVNELVGAGDVATVINAVAAAVEDSGLSGTDVARIASEAARTMGRATLPPGSATP